MPPESKFEPVQASAKSLGLAKWPGGILLRAMFVLGVLIGFVEGVVRFTAPDVLPRSLGSNQYQFEIKWYRLEEFVQERGGVDILIMGSSVTNTGFIPEEIAAALESEFGEVRVFNFGVEGFTVNLTAQIIEEVIQTTHPKVILFSTEVRDYSDQVARGTTRRVMSSPWIQHIGGEESIEGWLADNSLFYNYFLGLRNWTRPDYGLQREKIITRSASAHPDGYEPDKGVVHLTPPDPDEPGHQSMLDLFENYEIAPERLASLEKILAVGEEYGVLIITAEFPVAPEFYLFFGDGEADHQLFVQTVEDTVTRYNSYFIPAIPAEDMPSRGHSDYTHINDFGAKVYSQYIGEALMKLFLQENINFVGGGK